MARDIFGGFEITSIVFLGLWEKLHNPDFKGIDFDPILAMAGDNAFTMSPTRWIDEFNASGFVCKIGRGGGTFAHRDIAFEFTSWISAEFKLFVYRAKLTVPPDDREHGCYEPFVLPLTGAAAQIYFADETPYANNGDGHQNIFAGAFVTGII